MPNASVGNGRYSTFEVCSDSLILIKIYVHYKFRYSHLSDPCFVVKNSIKPSS
jgi:hypothetical protein